MKKGLSIILTLTLLMAILSGCGGDNPSSDSTQAEQPAPEKSKIAGNDIFGGKRYDEMLWGYYEFENYDYNGSFDDSSAFRQNMTYTTITTKFGDEVVSALPLTMQCGRYAHFMSTFAYDGEYYEAYTEKGKAMFRKAYMKEVGDLSEADFQKIEQIMNLMVAEVTMVQENGATNEFTFAYEIKGNQLSLYRVDIDEQYNIKKDTKPTLQYEFLHDGGKLILAYDDIQCIYRPYGTDATDTRLDVTGYALNDKNQYKDLAGISFYQYKDDGEFSVYPYLSNGNKPKDATITFDNNTGKFTLSWTKCWAYDTKGSISEVDDPRTISGTIIPCSSYGFVDYSGFIMIVDGVQYRYLMSEQEYEERISDLVGGNSLSDNKIEEINSAKKNLLAELEKAFNDAGITVKVDYAGGKIALEASFMFDTNSYQLSADGQKYLDSFMNVYTSVVLKEEYSAYISKIVVEGHTDTQGSYSLNQKLSENRANAVAQRCIANNPKIASIIEAVGFSYDYPVYNDDGSVNMAASRRVTFSFVFSG